MSKQSGLGDNLLVGGYNLSGDINAVDLIGCPRATTDVPGIDAEAMERIYLHGDGQIDFTAYFNPATDRAHPVLSALPTASIVASYLRGTTLGKPAACLLAKQVNYDLQRNADGSLTFKTSALAADGYPLEWGVQLTAGVRTDTGATNGTAVSADTSGDAAVWLPGAAGDYVSTPDAAAISITGDIDIRARVAADDWTPAAAQYLVSKWDTTGNQRSYVLILATSGALSLGWSADGSAATNKTATATVSATAGEVLWARATLDVDNGSGGYTVTFYTSTDGETWTQLGSTITAAGVTSIFDSTAVLELGSVINGTANNFAGKILEAEVYDGIDGTLVAHPVATTSGVDDATGLAWTLQGNAAATYGSAWGAQSYLQVGEFVGTDVTIKLQHSTDNGVSDAFADIPGGAFTQVTASRANERIATSGTLFIERYVRAVTSGGFTSAPISVVLVRNPGAVA